MKGLRMPSMRGVGCLLAAGIVALAAGCGAVSQTQAPASGTATPSSPAAAPASPVASQPAQAQPTSPLEKLPKSYQTAEELYAALAKLSPEEQQQAIVEGAKKEGKVILYGAGNSDHMPGWKKGFEALYPGVQMEFVAMLESDMTAKMQTEAKAGQHLWDIGTGIGMSYLRREGLVAKHYDIGLNKWPKEYRGEDWVGYQGLVASISYNTDLVKPADAPKTYAELLEPKWKGKVALDPDPDTFLSAAVLKWGEQKSRDYLRRLVDDQGALLRKGKTKSTGLLAAGEFPVAAELYTYRVEDMRVKDKAPIDWVVPELFGMELSGPVLAKKAPHPFAGLLLMQYILSKEGQAHFATFGRMTAHPEVELLYPRLKAFFTSPNAVILNPDTTEKAGVVVDKLVKEIIAPRVKGN